MPGPSEPTRSTVAAVSKDFFDVLGVSPILGRRLAPGDAGAGAEPVIIVSHGYWRRSLGSSQDLARSKLRIENRVYSVVGVMPPGFQFPAGADLWLPVDLDPENASRTSHNFLAIGRLRDGVSVAQARSELSAIARRIARASAEQGDYLLADAATIPLRASLTARVGSTLYTLLAAVLFLLLVACANVANLLLSQAAARGRELAIRHALGAGSGRLVRQFVTEALLLAACGCAAGVLVALWGLGGLLALAPPDLPRLESVSVSWPVLTFAVGISLLVALGLGVFVAVRATSRAPLLDAGRGQAGSYASRRAGRLVVAAQLAITLVLLVGAGLLGRSLLHVLSVDPGFRTDNVVTLDLSMPYAEGPAAKARLSQFFSSAFERLGATPGIEELGVASSVPLDKGLPDGMFLLMSPQEVPARPEDLGRFFAPKERQGNADFCVASSGYFRALGIPLVRGRLFDEHDGYDQPHVALVSESLASIRWPNQDPLGRSIEFGNMDGDLRILTIVGVVGDTRESGLEQPPRPTVYVNAFQRPSFTSTVVIRTSGDPRSVIGAARTILRDIAPDVPPSFRSLPAIHSASLGSRRFNLTLVVGFAATALLLAVAGIYGVTSYNVEQRTREIGVRVALGAARHEVLGMILGQGLRTALAGIAVGVPGALALTRTMQSLLFDVKPADPLTLLSAAAVLLGVAALACYVPARRATRVDPMLALRHE